MTVMKRMTIWRTGIRKMIVLVIVGQMVMIEDMNFQANACSI